MIIDKNFLIYDLIWQIAIPFISLNRRLLLDNSLSDRLLKSKLEQVDLWIQAASAGESYLACEILQNLKLPKKIKVLATSNTLQGLDILKSIKNNISQDLINIDFKYFPFDKPSIMLKAIRYTKPKLAVLLESQIWPGFFWALKKNNSKIIIVNGKISSKSTRFYCLYRDFWERIKPDKILAVSKPDIVRFSKIFKGVSTCYVPNIKFDRVKIKDNQDCINNINNQNIIILASVREEEKNFVKKMLLEIHKNLPNYTIALFPKHLHKIKIWEKILNETKINWVLKSNIKNFENFNIDKLSISVILWDIFGELADIYKIVKAAFIGGSLMPLGGQNFLEALNFGIKPVIGPYWSDFAWVGNNIIKQKLVYIAQNWLDAVKILINQVNYLEKNSNTKARNFENFSNYVKKYRGGTQITCDFIKNFILE